MGWSTKIMAVILLAACGPIRFGWEIDADQDDACGTAPNGTRQVRTAYEHTVAPDEGGCHAEKQARRCVDGEWTSWSGSYKHLSCSTEATLEPDHLEPDHLEPDHPGCTDPSVEHGGQQSRTRYREPRVSYGTPCRSEVQTRECSQGIWGPWSGTFEHDTCEPFEWETPEVHWGTYYDLQREVVGIHLESLEAVDVYCRVWVGLQWRNPDLPLHWGGLTFVGFNGELHLDPGGSASAEWEVAELVARTSEENPNLVFAGVGRSEVSCHFGHVH